MLIITNISLSVIISILTLKIAKNFLEIGLDEKIGTQKIHKKNAVRSIHIMNTSIVELYKFFLATENFKIPLLTATYTITLFLINLVSNE